MTTKIDISPEDQEILNYERYRYPVPLVRRRMEVLWLKSHNLPHEQIAKLAGISENTMREYFQLYKEGGIEKLKEVNFYRPKSELSGHITLLEAYFKENPVATINEAISKIKELTGIERSPTQVREFFKKNSIAVAGKSG